MRFGVLHAKALVSCWNWATFSAALLGYNGLGREDRWNAETGSALAITFLRRGKGLPTMVQGVHIRQVHRMV